MRLDIPLLHISGGFTDVTPSTVTQPVTEAFTYDTGHPARLAMIFEHRSGAVLFASEFVQLASLVGIPLRTHLFTYQPLTSLTPLWRLEIWIPYHLKQDVLKANVEVRRLGGEDSADWIITFKQLPALLNGLMEAHNVES